jgi:cyanate lyase
MYPSRKEQVSEGSSLCLDGAFWKGWSLRLHLYGSTMKELIEEKFGPGIMSAIDFTMDIERLADPKGDRVKITMNEKFLGYKKW